MVVVVKNDINILRDMKVVLGSENVEVTSLEINKLDDQNIQIEENINFPLPTLKEKLYDMLLKNDNILSYKFQ